MEKGRGRGGEGRREGRREGETGGKRTSKGGDSKANSSQWCLLTRVQRSAFSLVCSVQLSHSCVAFSLLTRV